MILRGQTAVVTGAGSGIGLALATRLASEGMNVVLADLDGDRAVEAAGAVIAKGARAVAVAADVADQASVEGLRETTLREFGSPLVLCNNAGIGDSSRPPIAETSLQEWQRQIGVNLFGVIHGVNAFLPAMLDRGQGYIVNTASAAGLLALPGTAPYTVAKHGVVAFSETLYQELLGTGIHVSCLCPGRVATRFFERGRRGDMPTPDRSAGMDPNAVAELAIYQGIHCRRFWVMTDPNYLEAIKRRHEDIQLQRNPRPPVDDK